MAKQRIKQRRKQRSGKRDQSGMKTETPAGIRERSNRGPRPHEPESLDGVDN